MWDSLKPKSKLLVFSAVTIIALIISVITHTWIPVVIAVFLDVGVTGMMIQLDKGALGGVK